MGYEQRMHRCMQIPAEEAAFMEEKGEVTRGSSRRRVNRVFLGLHQEFLTSGFSDDKEVFQVCGAREHVNRQSGDNKMDKTLFKASKTIYMRSILQDLERSGQTTT
jgi:hypothetical protein